MDKDLTNFVFRQLLLNQSAIFKMLETLGAESKSGCLNDVEWLQKTNKAIIKMLDDEMNAGKLMSKFRKIIGQ